MPTIILLFGLRFYFYSEEHLPIHIHVRNGDGRAKILVETLEVVDNSGIKPHDLKIAIQLVKQYQDYIIQSWNEYFSQ